MTVKIEMDRSTRFVFNLSPALEAAISIHVLFGARDHPLHLGWVRTCRGLPDELRAELKRYRFFFERGLGGLFVESAASTQVSFEHELQQIAGATEMDIIDELTTFLRPQDADFDDVDLLRRWLIQRLGEMSPETAAVVEDLLSDPFRELDRFLSMMTAYWENAFSKEFERIRPELETSIETAQQRLASPDWRGFFDAVGDRCRFDSAAGCLSLENPCSRDLALTAGRAMLLVPSVYTWPHVMSAPDNEPPLMIYPALSLTSAADTNPPRSLVRVLRLLADENRLRILRILAEQPRSTQELAVLTHLSEAAVSRHLTKLAAAGLVVARREGYYVVYHLVPDALSPLSRSLLAFIRGC